MADYRLIYNCPGCGKPSKTPEGALTNRCEYCGLVVRIGAPRRVLKYFYPSKIDQYGARMAADRYLKNKNLPLTENIIKTNFYYLPFYRFRGMALDYLAPAIEMVEVSEGSVMPVKSKPALKGKDFDVTVSAFASDQFKLATLGIRPKATPLYAFSRDELSEEAIIVGSNITPSQAEKQAMELHKNNISLYNKSEPICSAMIGEQISVIYFPVWAVIHEKEGRLNTVFVDALAKRGYNQTAGGFEYDGSKSTERNSYFIKPMKHQCPNCGADLQEKHFSLFYPCRNCDRAFIINSDGYREIKCLTAEANFCAPYWRFPLELKSRKQYRTVDEFYSLLTSEIALLRKEKRGRQFYLYSPAFKATDVTRWAKRASGVLKTQPHDRLFEKLPSESLDVCIDEIEAAEMAVFLWRMASAKYSKIQHDSFYFTENDLPQGELVWLPVQDFMLLSKSVDFREVNIRR
jgi:ribosomal protein L37AE/L43A